VIGLPVWLPSALQGLAFGIAVSALNYLILLRGQKKAETLPPEKGKNIVLSRYAVRYILNVLALFLVYKNPPMLIATAIGLTFNKNILFFKYLFKKP
jgi:ABC-type Fe3+-siderophore transport system permease subunit